MESNYKTIEVELTGRTPLLMNNPMQMVRGKRTRQVNKQESIEDEAEKTAYRDDKGVLCIPAKNVRAMIIAGSKGFKIGKQSLPRMLAGCVRIEPFNCSLGTKKFEIDSQRVVIQGNGIIKSRACLPEWKLKFNLIYDSNWISDPELHLKPVLESAGTMVGILDFRPEKYGSYGTFKVSGWKQLK